MNTGPDEWCGEGVWKTWAVAYDPSTGVRENVNIPLNMRWIDQEEDEQRKDTRDRVIPLRENAPAVLVDKIDKVVEIATEYHGGHVSILHSPLGWVVVYGDYRAIDVEDLKLFPPNMTILEALEYATTVHADWEDEDKIWSEFSKRGDV